MMINATTAEPDTCFGTRIGFDTVEEMGTRIGFDTVEEMGTRIGFNKDADTCPDFVPTWMSELVAA